MAIEMTMAPDDRGFSTRPGLIEWVIPFGLFVIGALPLLSLGRRADVVFVCGVLIATAALATALLARSRIRTVDGDALEVRHWAPRAAAVSLAGLRTVSTKRVRFSNVPALVLVDGLGATATIRLGCWRHEDRLIWLIGEAAARSDAVVTADTARVFEARPSAGWWRTHTLLQPRTPVGRWDAWLASAGQWLVQFMLVTIGVVAVYAALDLAATISENALFPRHVDAAWAEPHLVATDADSWVGNVATLDGRLFMANREDIDGFWGKIHVRSSEDGGESWSAPTDVSRGQRIARHTLIAGSDGALYAAWAKQGPRAQTQRLTITRSDDGGAVWRSPVDIDKPGGGLVGLPVLVMQDRVRLIVFTDGQTGEIWARPLDADGFPDGPASLVDVATRDLYADATFIDGHLALVAVGDRAVLSYVDRAGDVRIVVSDDSGRTWTASAIDQELYGGRPSLATDGSAVILAVSDPNRGSRSTRAPYVRIWRSVDQGTTWDRGPAVTDVAYVGGSMVAWAQARWHLLYLACPGVVGCATDPRIWYATSIDGLAWGDAIVVSEPGAKAPLGVIAAPDNQVLASWARGSGDHDWDIVVSRLEGRPSGQIAGSGGLLGQAAPAP